MNKKTYAYVDCDRCHHWTAEDRHERLCAGCNNSQKVIDPREILCNLCAGPMSPLGTENEQYHHGLYKAHVVGGYHSYHLFDMSRYTFSFCEKCLRELFIQCKIKPDVDDINFDNEVLEETGFESDQKQYEYKLWRDAGGHHQAYLERRCNHTKDCPKKAVYTVRINDDFSEDCCCEEHKWHEGGSIRLVQFIPHVLKSFL